MAEIPKFDPAAGGPAYMYVKVADHVAARIAAGDLVPDAMLPAERDMAEEYGVAVGTIRRAVEELRQRGLVVTLAAKGTFVVGKHTEAPRSLWGIYPARMAPMVLLMALRRPDIRPSSATPIYQQIVNHITAAVESGDVRPGDKLPGGRDLAEDWAVGYNTVMRAMQELRQSGIVEITHGKGIFIAEPDSTKPLP